jgi:hypothetical protein
VLDDRNIRKQTESVVDEPAIGVGFAVDVVDCVQSTLESFVDSNAITFGFIGAVVAYDCSVHLCLLVNVSELIFSERFAPALTLFL